MTTLSIPIDLLTVAELQRISAELVRRYMTDDNNTSVEAINMIRREITARKK